MEPEKKSNGAMVGLVVVVIILIIGGIYVWQTNMNNDAIENPLETLSEVTAENETIVTNQDAAALDSLDQELQATDAEAGVDASAVN